MFSCQYWPSANDFRWQPFNKKLGKLSSLYLVNNKYADYRAALPKPRFSNLHKHVLGYLVLKLNSEGFFFFFMAFKVLLRCKHRYIFYYLVLETASSQEKYKLPHFCKITLYNNNPNLAGWQLKHCNLLHQISFV